MSTEVVMPQMGESIAEGTVVRWIKKVGDKVDRDEPLFEISTDKVDAEVPSPAAGVVAEIRVKEGETVPVNSIVAVIGQSGEATAGQPAGAQTVPAPARGNYPRKLGEGYAGKLPVCLQGKHADYAHPAAEGCGQRARLVPAVHRPAALRSTAGSNPVSIAAKFEV